jgi:hypothetical protein
MLDSKRIRKLILSLLIIIIMLIFFLYLNKNYGFYIPCLFHKLTNLYCPGCGITRCIVSLLKGNISEAFKYNQLVFILLPFLTVYFIYKIYLYLTNSQDKIIKKIPNITWIILLIITILFGILRNIKYFPFLRP